MKCILKPLKQHNIVIMTKEESKKVAQQAEILRASEDKLNAKYQVPILPSPDSNENPSCFFFKNKKIVMNSGNSSKKEHCSSD
jgi:hypothetical protein